MRADPLVELLDLALLDKILGHQRPQAGVGQLVGGPEDPDQFLGPPAAQEKPRGRDRRDAEHDHGPKPPAMSRFGHLNDILDVLDHKIGPLIAEQRGDLHRHRLTGQLVFGVGIVRIVELEREGRDLVLARQERLQPILVRRHHVVLVVEFLAEIVPIDDAEVFELVHLGHLHFVARLQRRLEL